MMSIKTISAEYVYIITILVLFLNCRILFWVLHFGVQKQNKKVL